jgi:hypothetical protein
MTTPRGTTYDCSRPVYENVTFGAIDDTELVTAEAAAIATSSPTPLPSETSVFLHILNLRNTAARSRSGEVSFRPTGEHERANLRVDASRNRYERAAACD